MQVPPTGKTHNAARPLPARDSGKWSFLFSNSWNTGGNAERQEEMSSANQQYSTPGCLGSSEVERLPWAQGIIPDQGSNPCPLHGQVDSYPLSHQGSPLSDYSYVTKNSPF